MKIDAHQHFWKFDPIRDGWISEDMSVIRRDFLPMDLKPLLNDSGIDGCVAVQADQSEKETGFLLELAGQYPFIKGVVGWVDLLGDNLGERLGFYKDQQVFKGVRHILQSEPNGFMTSLKFVNGVGRLHDLDLTYDILTTEKQLPEACELIRLLPEMRLAIDHISKPDIKNQSFDHWAKQMKTISSHDHVYVKLSGMVTEADLQNWTVNDLKKYVDFCLEHFGPQRLMFGSDWPVCLLGGSYQKVYQALLSCIAELSGDEQSWILGKTATVFYHLT